MRCCLLSLLILSPFTVAQQASWPLLPVEAAALPRLSDDPVQSLLLGSFYYHYLNDDYQSAFNTLQQFRNDLPDAYRATADLLETTLLLALGMDNKARRQFSALSNDAAGVPADVWFYLARRWFAAAEWEKTEEALNQALTPAATLSPGYRQEALFMLASSLIEQDRTPEAARIMTGIADTGLWAGLARHNLLLGSIRGYAPIHEIERLVREAVFYLPSTTEGRAVSDRVRLLAGIYSLESGRLREAERYLQDASLNSAYTAPALLQFGWARMEQHQYEQALQPWRVLQQQFQPWHPAVVESILAVPYSLEIMNATTQALKSYENVEVRLQSMLTELKTLQQPDSIQQWLGDWTAQQQGGWGWRRHATVEAADSPMTRSLMGLLSQSAFQQHLSQLHDLQRMQDDLRTQQHTLALWVDMLEQRRQAFVQANGDVRLRDLNRQQQQLQEQVAALLLRWEDEERKLFAYASDDDLQRLTHIDRVVPRIAFLQRINTPTRDLNLYKERWRRARGVLLWQMYEHQPQRRWDAEQSFWQLHQELSLLQEQLDNSRLALSWADSRWVGLDPRIQQQQQNISRLLQRLERLQQEQQQVLAVAINDHLQELDTRLSHYLAQARLAIARLYDDALQLQLSADIPAVLMPVGEQP